MPDLPPTIIPFFTDAGWVPHRRQSLPQNILNQIPEKHPAINMLTQFNGLKVGVCGTGEECATSDIDFQFIEDNWDDIIIWNDLLLSVLIGIAEVQHMHMQLYIDQLGKCYILSLIDDEFLFCGNDFSEAMAALLLGRKLRPMLRPGQDSVTSYGITLTANSPEIYQYDSN